jgi:hypothetical protein
MRQLLAVKRRSVHRRTVQLRSRSKLTCLASCPEDMPPYSRKNDLQTTDSLAHGTSQQRAHWFGEGFQSGDVGACNTFAQVEPLSLPRTALAETLFPRNHSPSVVRVGSCATPSLARKPDRDE